MLGAPVGIIVVGYHAPKDLTDFCWSLVGAHPQIPFFFNLQSVEVTEEESEVAGTLVEMVAEEALAASTTNHFGNVGYARACNDGARWIEIISEGTVDTYAFFNADTLITPGVIEQCVETLWSHEDYAVVGPRQVNMAGRLTHAGIFGTDRHPRHRGWWEPASDGRYSDITDACLTVSGSAYFAKVPVWNELRECSVYQMADPDSLGAFLQTRHYYEEAWFSYHARKHGYKVVYDGTKTMCHKWMGSTPQGEWQAKVYEESRATFRAACELHGIECE